MAITSLRKPGAVRSCAGVVAGVRIGERWCGEHHGQPSSRAGGGWVRRASSLGAGEKNARVTHAGPQEEKGRADGAEDREVNFRRVEFVGPVSWWGMKVSHVSVRQEKERAVEDPDFAVNSRQGSESLKRGRVSFL